jgi:hypothetical protein
VASVFGHRSLAVKVRAPQDGWVGESRPGTPKAQPCDLDQQDEKAAERVGESTAAGLGEDSDLGVFGTR